MQTSEIRIRDPFILPVVEEDRYYLFGTTDITCWDGAGEGLEPEPLWDADGGHGMVFCTFEGRSMLTFHCPNRSPEERATFHELEDTGDSLCLWRGSSGHSGSRSR